MSSCAVQSTGWMTSSELAAELDEGQLTLAGLQTTPEVSDEPPEPTELAAAHDEGQLTLAGLQTTPEVSDEPPEPTELAAAHDSTSEQHVEASCLSSPVSGVFLPQRLPIELASGKAQGLGLLLLR